MFGEKHRPGRDYEIRPPKKVNWLLLDSINKSINQISIAPISLAKPASVVRQSNQCSTAKLKKQFRNINRPWGMLVSVVGKAKSKSCVFICFLQVATEIAEQTEAWSEDEQAVFHAAVCRSTN